jgi:hypothetical protein
MTWDLVSEERQFKVGNKKGFGPATPLIASINMDFDSGRLKYIHEETGACHTQGMRVVM